MSTENKLGTFPGKSKRKRPKSSDRKKAEEDSKEDVEHEIFVPLNNYDPSTKLALISTIWRGPFIVPPLPESRQNKMDRQYMPPPPPRKPKKQVVPIIPESIQEVKDRELMPPPPAREPLAKRQKISL